jgi:hypothetical protein
MMEKFGDQIFVSFDATFGTNQNMAYLPLLLNEA